LALGISVSAHAATIQFTMDNLVISPAEATAKLGDTPELINKDILATRRPRETVILTWRCRRRKR
jgi:hypothetical protein